VLEAISLQVRKSLLQDERKGGELHVLLTSN